MTPTMSTTFFRAPQRIRDNGRVAVRAAAVTPAPPRTQLGDPRPLTAPNASPNARPTFAATSCSSPKLVPRTQSGYGTCPPHHSSPEPPPSPIPASDRPGRCRMTSDRRNGRVRQRIDLIYEVGDGLVVFCRGHRSTSVVPSLYFTVTGAGECVAGVSGNGSPPMTLMPMISSYSFPPIVMTALTAHSPDPLTLPSSVKVITSTSGWNLMKSSATVLWRSKFSFVVVFCCNVSAINEHPLDPSNAVMTPTMSTSFFTAPQRTGNNGRIAVRAAVLTRRVSATTNRRSRSRWQSTHDLPRWSSQYLRCAVGVVHRHRWPRIRRCR